MLRMYEIIMTAGSENDGRDQEIKKTWTAAWSRNPLPFAVNSRSFGAPL